MINGNGDSRRDVLKLTAASAIGLAGVSSAQASDPDSNEDEADNDAIDVVGGTNDKADQKKNTKHDYEQSLDSLGLSSEVGAMVTSPDDPTREHLEYLDHREESGTLESIMKIADVEWMITAWEAIDGDGNTLTDSNGDYYYVLEFLAVSEEESGWWRNDGQTTSLIVETELTSSASMEGRDPRTTHSVNGGWVTVSAGATIDGYGVSASTEQWVEHGDFGPETWSPGTGGEYGVMFDGETPGGGQTDIVGFASVTQSYKASNIWSIIDEWSWEAEGNHIEG